MVVQFLTYLLNLCKVSDLISRAAATQFLGSTQTGIGTHVNMVFHEAIYLKCMKMHVDKLANGGELRNLTFFRGTVKNAKSPKKSQTWGGG